MSAMIKTFGTCVCILLIALCTGAGATYGEDTSGNAYAWQVVAQLGHTSTINAVAFSPDGRTLASGSFDKTIKLWDVTSGREIRTLSGHSDIVESVAFSHDGRTLASASRDQTIKLWDVASGREIRTLSGHSDGVKSVAFAPDGRTLASASNDKTIKLWDVASGREIRTLSGHSDAVLSVAFSPDGRTLTSGSGDHTIKLWDVASGREIRTLSGHSDVVESVAFSPEGRTLASASFDRTIKLWDMASGREIRTLNGHLGAVLSVAFSHDGRMLASASRDHTIKLWDVASGREIRTLSGHSSAVASVAFSPDGRTLASGSGDHTIKLWDVASGREIRTLSGHSDVVWSVAFSPDGRTLASASWDHTIKLWDVASGHEIRTLSGHSDGVKSVVFSPDGRTLASGSFDYTIKLWDVAIGCEIRTLSGHSNWVESVAFSPDGRTLASGSVDQTIKLWEVASGREIRTLSGHSEFVLSVAFSPDGRTLASASFDKTIKLWDVASGREIRTLSGHSNVVASVTFSPDGKTLASGSWDGTIRLWGIERGKELVALIGYKDGSSLTITPEGFFSEQGDSEQVDKMVGITRGLNSYAVSQFYETLHRPDLIQALLAGDHFHDYSDAAHSLNLQSILDQDGSPPELQLLPHSIVYGTAAVHVGVRIIDTGGGIGHGLTWQVNGHTFPGPDAPAMKTGGETAVTVYDDLSIDPKGSYTLSVTAANAKGTVRSAPLEITVGQGGAASHEKARLFALAIGIDHYGTSSGLRDLQAAARDASSIVSTLSVASKSEFPGGFFPTLVTDETPPEGLVNAFEPTKEGIQKAFAKVTAELAQDRQPDDVFVLFMGGHGMFRDGRWYFVPKGFNEEQSDLARDAIRQEDLKQWIAGTGVLNRVIILDSCESAEGALSLASRGSESFAIRDTGFDQLQHATGDAVFAASEVAANEEPWKLGHGILTYAILEGFSPDKDAERSQLVSTETLGTQVYQAVNELSLKYAKSEQHPRVIPAAQPIPLGFRVVQLAAPPTVSSDDALSEKEFVLSRDLDVATSADTRTGSAQSVHLKRGTVAHVIEEASGRDHIAWSGGDGWVPADALIEILPP